MKIYMAPMEGVTGYIYRNAHHQAYAPLDKYFTPFIVPSDKRKMRNREKRDVLPENNTGIPLIPQILTNSGEAFVELSKELEQLGYEEVNLNLGCPSGTVTAKGKGAGALADPDHLEAMLGVIFRDCPLRVSVKTRLGIEKDEEFARLLGIYDHFPVEEMILHPRVLRDFYRNTPRTEPVRLAMSEFHHPLVYNGNLFTAEDIRRIAEQFPELSGIMLGRGLIANPGLGETARRVLDAPGGSVSTNPGASTTDDGEGTERLGQVSADGSASMESRPLQEDPAAQLRQEETEKFRRFHDLVYAGHTAVQCGDRNLMFRMKELWYYMIHSFDDHEAAQKKLRKIQTAREYEAWFREMMRSGTFHPERGFCPPE